jgi:hypothetical protein
MQVAVAVRETPTETLCVTYLKSRLEIGAAFVLDADLMQDALQSMEDPSTVDCDAIVDACFAPKTRPAALRESDVFFVVVDPTPEKKKLRRDVTSVRETSHVVIRLHVVQRGPQPKIAPSAVVSRIDVRPWCSSPVAWHAVVGGLLRCDRLLEFTHFGCATKRVAPQLDAPGHRVGHPPLPISPDHGELLALEFSPTVGGELVSSCSGTFDYSDNRVLAKLVSAVADEEGMTAFDIEGSTELEMNRLVAVGAVARIRDEFDPVRFKVRPEGVRFSLRVEVLGCVYDMSHLRASQSEESRNIKKWSKVEMMYELFDRGFIPIAFAAADECLTPTSPRSVLCNSLLRSRLYFEVLLQLDSVFEKGIGSVVHCGPHHYYV